MKTLLTAALAALTLSASAAANSEFCAEYRLMAISVMDARQAGADASKVWEVVEGNAAQEKMVLMAYDWPRFTTHEHIERAKEDFGNEWFIGCLKAFGEDV